MKNLLEVEDLRVEYRGRPIVGGVSFSLAKGESLGLAGESGCGKTTTALSLMKMLPDGLKQSGGITLRPEGVDEPINIGKRTKASLAYDAVVASYKKKPTPLLIKSLRESCAAVLAADDEWKTAFEAMQAVEQRTFDLVTDLLKTDAQWSEAEKAIKLRLDGTTTQLANITAQRASDEAACPKVKY